MTSQAFPNTVVTVEEDMPFAMPNDVQQQVTEPTQPPVMTCGWCKDYTTRNPIFLLYHHVNQCQSITEDGRNNSADRINKVHGMLRNIETNRQHLHPRNFACQFCDNNPTMYSRNWYGLHLMESDHGDYSSLARKEGYGLIADALDLILAATTWPRRR